MNFINVQVFWLAPAIIVFMLLTFWLAQTKRRRILAVLFGVKRVAPEHIIVSHGRRMLRFLLLMIVALLLLTTIARPWWGNRLVPYESKTRDLLVLFDVSKSMLAQDVPPSRLEHAKWLLRQLVDASEGDRFGLVAFAGDAFLECPFTIDKTSFHQYIDELNVDSIPVGGTNLEIALREATSAFKGAEGVNRAIVMITDGEELDGDSAQAIRELKRLEIPLFIIGLGDPNTPALVPLPQGEGQSPTFMRDRQGRLVKTRLNETLLQGLAASTNGIYVRSSVTNPQLSTIQQHIKGLVPEKLEQAIRTRPIERFHYFLAVATGLIFLWLLLSERGGTGRCSSRIPQFLSPLLLSAFMLFASSSTGARPEEQSPRVSPSMPHDLQAAELPPGDDEKSQVAPETDDPVAFYNSARALQEARKSAEAAGQYEIAINLADKQPEVRRRAFQNLGVIEHARAREQISQSVAALQQQLPDEALRQLEQVAPRLARAEEMYVKSMSIKTTPEVEADAAGSLHGDATRDTSAVNQQLLLHDREMVDKLKKMIEELKQQQQEAREKTQKAAEQQQQQSRSDQDGAEQSQEKQGRQEKQEQQRQAAQQALDQARNAVDRLKEQAEKLEQEEIGKNAQKAGEELKQAKEAADNQQDEQAAEHIGRALRHLGEEQPDKSDQSDQHDPSASSDQPDKPDQPDQPRKPDDSSAEQPTAPTPGKEQEKQSEVDPEQVRAVLEMMARQEKDFRRALKEHQKQIRGEVKVDKDW